MFLGETQDCPMGIATPLSERQLLQENERAFHDVWATSELALQAEHRDMWSCLAAEGFDYAEAQEVIPQLRDVSLGLLDAPTSAAPSATLAFARPLLLLHVVCGISGILCAEFHQNSKLPVLIP